MTDAEIRDAAVQHLQRTSVGFVNKYWKTPPAGTEWKQALDLLAQIGAAPPPPPPPGDPGMPDRSLQAWNAALPVGMTVTPIRTLGEWNTAWPVGAGQLLDVLTPLALPALRTTKRYSDWAACRFAPGVSFAGGWYMEGDRFASFGGRIPMAQQHAFAVSNADHLRVWGLQSDGCGAHSLFVFANVGAVTQNVDIEMRMTRCGQNTAAYDPHAEKGTGVHPWYLGSDDAGKGGVGGKYVLTGYDCPTGSGQLGNSFHNAELWLDGRRFTKVATSQVAGNLVQLWGGGNHDVTIHRAYGEDLAGRMVETDDLGSASNITVEWARGVRCRLSPLYTAHSGVTYKDCA